MGSSPAPKRFPVLVATTSPLRLPAQATYSSSPLPSPSQLLGNAGGGERLDQLPPDAALADIAIAYAAQHNVGPNSGRPSTSDEHQGAGESEVFKSKEVCQSEKISNANGRDGAPAFRNPYSIVMEDDSTKVAGLDETVVLPVPQVIRSDVMPPKKRRKKTEKPSGEERGQSKMKKHRIVKPRAIKDTMKIPTFKTARRSKDDRSPERLLSKAVAKAGVMLVSNKDEGLGIDTAVKRRAEWSPVKDSTDSVAERPLSACKSSLTRTSDTMGKSQANFARLLGDYTFANEGDNKTSVPITMQVIINEAPTTIRRIEVVNIEPTATSTVVQAKATKSLKRKLQTITAKATEDFVRKDASNVTPTVIDYMIQTPNTAKVKQARRKSTKSKTSTANSKKAAETAPIVLSPETAMKATINQSVLFGTSSQLVREESPSDLRGYQQAIKASLEDPSLVHITNMSSPAPQRLNSLALSPSKSLWSAASCHEKTEFVDLANTPKAGLLTESKPLAEEISNQDASPVKAQDVWHDVGDMESPTSKPSDDAQGSVEKMDREPEQSLPRSLAEKALRARSKPTSAKGKAASTKTFSDEMPNYQGFSDAQLKKVIKSYGFKAISRRETMISRLVECWENKQSQVLQELHSNAILPQTKRIPLPEQTATVTGTEETEPCGAAKKKGRPRKAIAAEEAQSKAKDPQAKKPRGRPKKDPPMTEKPTPKRSKAKAKPKDKSSKPATDVGDEIYDSAPPTPSPPRRRTPSKSAKTLTLSPSSRERKVTKTIADATTPTKDNPGDHNRLHVAITQAVKSQKPTHDPKNPSWHERLLMYEPLVIEDLTRWLNVEGLPSVDEDDEVGPLLVKEWCESQSICCLWKENLRGLPRARW